MVIKLAARADLHHLGLFLQGRQTDAPQEALQVLDIVLRELPTTRFLLQFFLLLFITIFSPCCDFFAYWIFDVVGIVL